ncbi:MAG: SprT-like domain-containing protein [Haloferacaceae archaeon]
MAHEDSRLDCELDYGDVADDEGLRRWSAAYAERAVDEYGLAVDLSRVDWEVSTRAKRRAAAVKRPRVDDAEVGTAVDWESTALGPDVPRCTVSLTRAAFESYTRREWTETLRHELVHVEQFQRDGATDHGPRFRRRASEVDAPLACRRFATPKYRLWCAACGDVVARRYRDCKLVRESDRYRSNCCAASLRCERVDGERGGSSDRESGGSADGESGDSPRSDGRESEAT